MKIFKWQGKGKKEFARLIGDLQFGLKSRMIK
jgi:hypothetical protein